MKFDQNIKAGIIASVIASIIVLVFLQPLLRFTTNILFGVGADIFRAYTNRLFTQTALLAPPDAALNLYGFVLSLFLGVLVGIVAWRIAFWWNPERPRNEEAAKRLIASTAKFPWLSVVGTMLLAIVIFALIYSSIFQMRVITSFRQHMLTIAPYITDQRGKELYSQWTQMRTEADYQRIYSELNRIAGDNHVVLPENLVFSLKQL